ncbi:Protein eyes shut [Liparis tanakae]|uniref:Protein eyes shut n=1 Tax=Liparis tanakae TaxID=230148 RepID=A0A4Z2HQE0_9TELE|nr:Protein eyes shut [Liparis tanakae]
MAASTQTTKPPLQEPQVCHDSLCLNGGTCHQLQRPGAALPSCHCPLHFTGTFCEKDTTVYIPSFDGTSYLELPPLSSLLQPSGASNNLPATVKDTTVILYLTVKTRSTQGSILYNREKKYKKVGREGEEEEEEEQVTGADKRTNALLGWVQSSRATGTAGNNFLQKKNG